MAFRKKKHLCNPRRNPTWIIYSDESRNKLEKAMNIVDFISQLTPLRKCKNGDHVGICLICERENGPSSKNHLRINCKNNMFKCFRCGRAGKLTGFVKQYYNVGYDKAFSIIYNRLPKEKRFEYSWKRKEYVHLRTLEQDIRLIERQLMLAKDNLLRARKDIMSEDLPF
jgi:DNA primase